MEDPESKQGQRAGGEDPWAGEKERFHRILGEKLVPEILRRGIESGMDAFLRSDRGVRKAVSDLRLGREVTSYLFHQVDDTRNAALRVIAREVRDFLENTNLEQSLRAVLTSLAFEIRTEVRFVPADGGGVRPIVRSAVGKARRVARGRARKAGKQGRAGKGTARG